MLIGQTPFQILEAIARATSLHSACAVANQMTLEVARKESSARTDFDRDWEGALAVFADIYGMSICSWCNFIVIDEGQHEQCRHDEYADAMTLDSDEGFGPEEEDEDDVVARVEAGITRQFGSNTELAREARHLYPGGFV